jgi:hypothetical protein
MSTKIYNGFSVSTDSAVCLMDLVNSFRPYVRAEGQKMLNQFLRKTGTTEDPFRGWTAWMELRAETVDKGIRAPGVDTDFQLVFFPDGDRFLGVAFTEHSRWFRHWLRQPSVSEYVIGTTPTSRAGFLGKNGSGGQKRGTACWWAWMRRPHGGSPLPCMKSGGRSRSIGLTENGRERGLREQAKMLEVYISGCAERARRKSTGFQAI